MTHADSLIQLIKSLSKNEKRAFRIGKKSTADYIILFDLIDKNNCNSVDQLKETFERLNKGGVFNVTVTYLYKLLLDRLLSLRQNQDIEFSLFSRILKAQILFEKSIFPAALDMLNKVKQDAAALKKHEALLYASRLELDYLQYLGMPDVSEEELINKQFNLSAAFNKLNNFNEQSNLYQLLKHRIIYKGEARSERQKASLNDLVFREHATAQKSRKDIDIHHRHLHFQATYFMAIGDHLSASEVLLELNRLTAENPDIINPLYHVSLLENMLDNLRSMHKYEAMPVFIRKLLSINHPSQFVTSHVQTLSALYELLPLIDFGEFQAAKDFIDHNESLQAEAIELLTPALESKVALYKALVHIGLKDYKRAKRVLVRAMLNKQYDLPIYRILRIVNLIIHHKMNDLDYIFTETRSLKRDIAKADKAYRTELVMLEVVGKGSYSLMSTRKRELIWQRIQPQLDDIKNDIFESQLLKIFDFTAWIEAEIKRLSFSDILKRNLGQI